ncbi:transforming acidic coiled-coil-containing protein 3-like isoform X2 [Littorina saxatilis]|uniref:transforming acidic coiled-coil-containing protein 3-like isoform X2 n=1 Tax=Littorina saxatilis TaxID=31220 RepID=UPI0038B47757
MEEDQGRASPPLPSKGAYNIDFDALDDAYNPFQTKKAIPQSPPLGRKNSSNSAETVPDEQPVNNPVPDKKLVEEPIKVPATTVEEPSAKPAVLVEESGEKPANLPEKQCAKPANLPDEQSAKPANLPEKQSAKPANLPEEQIAKPANLPEKQSAKPAHLPEEQSASPASDKVQDSSNLLKEPSEKPKRKKSKSPASKRASTGSDIIDGQAVECPQPTGNASEDVPVTEKPVKTKKVVKKSKSRPVSKNLEGQGTPEKPQAPEGGSEASATAAPAKDAEAVPPPPDKTTPNQPQETMVTTEDQPKPLAEKTLPPPEKTPPPPEKTPQESEKTTESAPEKAAQQTETAPAPADKTSSQSEQTPSKATSAVGENAVESPPKKERSGKVKKTKSKVKKSPRSSAVDGGVDADPSAGGDHEKESKIPPRVNSQGDSAGSHDSTLDPDAQKSKHPAARVLEQQIRDDPQAKHTFPNESEDDFYDAFDTSPSVTMDELDQMQSYNDMNDSCMLYQSRGDLGGLSWSQEDSTLLDGGAGEAAFSEDLTLGDSDMADSRTESVVKLVQGDNLDEVLKYSQSDWNKLKQELELNFQAQLLSKEREWSSKLADRDSRISTLDDTNKKLRQTNEDMRTVMAEFEKTIGQLQSEKEKTTNASQLSLQDVIKERDQALEDLQSVETAFSDLHRRYEKTKGVVEGFKQNEEMLKKCVQDLQNKLKKAESKVQIVKEQAEEKLERATEEIEKTQKSTASDIARLEAALRKAELQVQSMESTLDQKVRENKELAAICDELIAKVQ